MSRLFAILFINKGIPTKARWLPMAKTKRLNTNATFTVPVDVMQMVVDKAAELNKSKSAVVATCLELQLKNTLSMTERHKIKREAAEEANEKVRFNAEATHRHLKLESDEDYVRRVTEVETDRVRLKLEAEEDCSRRVSEAKVDCSANKDKLSRTLSLELEQADNDLAAVMAAIDKEWKQSLQYRLEQALLSGGYPLYEKYDNRNFTRDNIRAFVDEKVADSVNSWACNENVLLIATKHNAAAFKAIETLVASTLSMRRFMDKPLAALDYIANGSICRCSDEYVEAFELEAQVSWSSLYSMSEPWSVFSASVDNKGVWSVLNGTDEYADFIYKFKCIDYDFGTKYYELYDLQTLAAGVWSD